MSRRVARLKHQFSVPVCEVSWKAAEREFGKGIMTSDYVNVKHFHHSVLQLLWWRVCAKDVPHPEHIWFVEYDAFFTGNVQNFIQTYAAEDTDLIGAGFRVVGKEWWLWGRSHASQMTHFNRSAQVVRNLNRLPSLADGVCHDPPRYPGEIPDEQGIIFRQVNVERISRRLMQELDQSLDHLDKRFLPDEAWASTLCAQQLTHCSMLDFAPAVPQARDDKAWASPHYCWRQEFTVNQSSLPHCSACKMDAAWQGKWIHPVRANSLADIDCSKQVGCASA